MPMPKENFKVFISHATYEDGDLVNWMADALDRLHIRAFVYERYQRGGQNRFEVIKNMIVVCPYFLVMLTEAGIASQWVNQEIGYAVGVGKEIIPIIEVDEFTGKRIESKGFVELHDQIEYHRNNLVGLMAQVIYTFYSILYSQGMWQDIISLSCVCSNRFEGQLYFEQNWEAWLQVPDGKPFNVWWPCKNCQQQVTISFPDCHLLPQEG